VLATQAHGRINGMSLKISRILHAGYVFESGGIQIAFDPIFENPFSQNCYAYPNVQFDREQIKKINFAAVFISHFHDDHCSLESLDLLNRETPIYIYCHFDELFSMIRELGFVNVNRLGLNVPIKVGPIEIIPLRALDIEVDSMFHIKVGKLNILNVVDSWLDPSSLDELVQFAPWDMLLWPFQTMREIEVLAPRRASKQSKGIPHEWLEQIKILNPRFVVPSSCQFIQESWSWYNHALFPISYRQFQNEVEAMLPLSQVVRMNPSVSLTLDSENIEASDPLRWVQPIGDQNVDYQFNKQIEPQPTAEISKYFAKLSDEKAKRVYEYCLHGLIEKYKSLPPPQDPYFEKIRYWRLSIFDHNGEAKNFDYQIFGDKIEILQHSCQDLSWTTELPISKFYSALENGEALTSMYVRINDNVFTPDIEKEIADADVVEDPLVRCLFTREFGAYQKAQLALLQLADIAR
jgi:hypothetical protein